MSDIRKALNETTNSAGGFTVPDEFSSRLLAYVQQKSICMEDLETVQMNSDILYIPKVTSGSTAYWVVETASITESAPAYGQITLSAKKVAALTAASSELLEDNIVGLANHLVNQMAEDLTLAIDSQLYTGTGTPWYGLNNTASYTNAVDGAGNINATAAAGTGSSITGGAVSLAVIAKAVTEVLKDNQQQPDISYWNPRTIGSLMVLTDSTTRPIFNMETFGSPIINTGVIGQVYGTRAKASSQVPINISYGTTAALSANCSDALVGRSKMFGFLGQRRGFTWKDFYVISTDVYQWQTTARMAFATKYPNAYCMIRGLTN